MYNNGKTNINIYSGILFFKQPCYAINEIYEEESMEESMEESEEENLEELFGFGTKKVLCV